MEQTIRTLNTFFENTCVIVVFAYILTRGRLIGLLFQEPPRGRAAAFLGCVFGLMGLLELFFASLRFPYDTYTLIVTFAIVNAGLRVGVVTATFISLGSVIFLTPEAILRTSLALFASVAVADLVRRAVPRNRRLMAGLLAMVLAEAVTLLIRLWWPGQALATFSEMMAIARVVANGAGIILLQLIVNDAQLLARSEQYRVEAERNRTLQAESQLTDLRARMNPHFLFNTLTSIAGLCPIAPDKAEKTIVQLSHIMRRAMEDNAKTLVPLRDESEHVCDYIEIEQIRLANRLRVFWRSDAGSEQALVPPFSVQALVENAINHGIAPRSEAGTVTITTRQRRGYMLIAVQDDGAGISKTDRPRVLASEIRDRPHALQILNQQLQLLYGPSARLRLFSSPGQGTLVAFVVPTNTPSLSKNPSLSRGTSLLSRSLQATGSAPDEEN